MCACPGSNVEAALTGSSWHRTTRTAANTCKPHSLRKGGRRREVRQAEARVCVGSLVSLRNC